MLGDATYMLNRGSDTIAPSKIDGGLHQILGKPYANFLADIVFRYRVPYSDRMTTIKNSHNGIPAETPMSMKVLNFYKPFEKSNSTC